MIKLLSRKDKIILILFIFLNSILSFLEVLNISLIFPIIEEILNISDNKSNYYYFLKQFFFGDNSLKSILLIFLLLFVIKNIYFLFLSFFQNKYLFNFKLKISNKIFQKIISSSLKLFDSKNSSSYIKNIIGDTTQVSQCLSMVIYLFADIVVLVCIFIMLFIFNPIVTIYIFILLIFTLFVYIFYFKKKFSELGEKRYFNEERVYRLLNNSFGSFTEIKLFKKEKYFNELFQSANKPYINILRNYDFLQSIPRSFFELIGISAIVIILIYISSYSEDRMLIYLPLVSVFSVSLIRLMPIFNRITISLQNIRFGLQTVRLLNEELNKFESSNIKKLINNTFVEFDKINIKVSNLNFEYDNKKIFKDLNLEIKNGDKIGIYGESGSGKSTLLKIISGLVKYQGGQVMVNNFEIHEKIDDWQKKIAYLKQENFIIDSSLINNICFGEKNINKEQLDFAINSSNLSSFLNGLEYGLETNIGENGKKISGGEKQRICIARSLYFNKKLFIFDEPTASLDEKNEKEIIHCINSLKNKTVILVTHKKKNLEKFDKVFKLINNKLVLEKKIN